MRLFHFWLAVSLILCLEPLSSLNSNSGFSSILRRFVLMLQKY